MDKIKRLNSGRPVTVYKIRRGIKVKEGTGIFHAFGCDYEEYESDVGNYSTAIIELPDGTVKNVRVELISFNEGSEKK